MRGPFRRWADGILSMVAAAAVGSKVEPQRAQRTQRRIKRKV
jgi:hypothetical protein